MTRFQYANAVKDLLDLKVEVFPLPEKDDAGIVPDILNQKRVRCPIK